MNEGHDFVVHAANKTDKQFLQNYPVLPSSLLFSPHFDVALKAFFTVHAKMLLVSHNRTKLISIRQHPVIRDKIVYRLKRIRAMISLGLAIFPGRASSLAALLFIHRHNVTFTRFLFCADSLWQSKFFTHNVEDICTNI